MPLPGSSFGYSAASRRPRLSIAACACATVTPSLRRAFTKKPASTGRRSRARGGPPSAGTAEIGSQKSVTRPMLSVALWPAGPTPTIVTGTPCMRMVRPMTDGSPPKRVVHAWWPMTATMSVPGRSSAASNQRPSDGCSPSTARYVAVVYSTTPLRTAPRSR